MLLEGPILFLAVLCYQSVIISGSKNKLCDLKDSKCLTRNIQRVYLDIINGDSKDVPSSDPLYVDSFEFSQDALKYRASNTTLSGLKNCTPKILEIFFNDIITYKFELICKHLIFEGHYERKSNIGLYFVEGNGEFKANLYDYDFLISGDLYSIFDENNKIHYLNKNPKVDIEAGGKVLYNIKNLFNGDEEKTAATLKYLDENRQIAAKAFRFPALQLFMEKFMIHVNAYFTKVPTEDVYYE